MFKKKNSLAIPEDGSNAGRSSIMKSPLSSVSLDYQSLDDDGSDSGIDDLATALEENSDDVDDAGGAGISVHIDGADGSDNESEREPAGFSQPHVAFTQLASGDDEDDDLRGQSKDEFSAKSMFARDSIVSHFTWDLCLVFDLGDESKTCKLTLKDKSVRKQNEAMLFRRLTEKTILQMRRAGIHTVQYLSSSTIHPTLICLVGCDERRLAIEADRTDYDMPLDADACLAKGRSLGIRLATFTDADDDAHLSKVDENAWKYLFGQFSRSTELNPDRESLYAKSTDARSPLHPNSLFRAIDRFKITRSIIEADVILGGAGIPIAKLMHSKTHPLNAFFPLHKEKPRQKLVSQFSSSWMVAFHSPSQGIREYFGEKIAIYFVFLEHYVTWLSVPAAVGLVMFIWQVSVGEIGVSMLIVFAFFMMMWSTVMLEYWKRTSAAKRVRWGMTNYKQKEMHRPEFVGEMDRSPIDGRVVLTFPFTKKLIRQITSVSVIVTFLAIVLSIVSALFQIRSEFGTGAQYTMAAITGAQIKLFNIIYMKVAIKLNDWENHHRQTGYENALIAKVFLFKFVNSYYTLFYIAFVQRHETGEYYCTEADCLKALRQQLGMLLFAHCAITHTVDMIGTFVGRILAARKRKKFLHDNPDKKAALDREEKNKSKPQADFELAPYESTFGDFDELIIQFGYVCLFTVALPLVPLFAFLINMFEMRFDSIKLLKFKRRPLPESVYGIGAWYRILSLISALAVITNVAVVVWSTDFVSGVTGHKPDTDELFLARVYAFVILEHAFVFSKLLVQYLVPDEPKWVVVHKEREQYICDCLLMGVEERAEDLFHDLHHDSDDDDEGTKGDADGDDTNIVYDESVNEDGADVIDSDESDDDGTKKTRRRRKRESEIVAYREEERADTSTKHVKHYRIPVLEHMPAVTEHFAY